MGKKQQKKSRGSAHSTVGTGPAHRAGRPSEPVTGELAGAIREAHGAGAWGKVIALWQQAAGTKGNRPPLDADVAALAADAYDQHGMHLFRNRNVVAATLHFGKAAALSPDQSPYQYHLALAHHRSAHWQDAIGGYRTVLRLAPDDHRAAYHLCLACLQSGLECQPGGALDKALDLLQPRTGDGPTPWEVRRLQAWRAYVRSGSTVELAALHAAQRRPEPALALEAAVVTLLSGKAEGARRRLPDPSDSEADPLSACVEALRPLLSARAGHYRQATALGTGLAESRVPQGQPHWNVVESVRIRALWEAGLAAWQNGDRTGAAPLWEGALNLDPENSSLRLNVALALDAADDPAAGRHWQELARTWERSAGRKATQDGSSLRMAAARAYQRAGHAEIPCGNWREARRLMERAFNLAPGSVEILFDLAHLARLTGDRGWLRSQGPKLLELLRDDAARLADVGHLLDEPELQEVAEPIWRRVLELEPEHECAGEHLASLYEFRGEEAWAADRLADAAACFERGLALTPEVGRLHIWLGGIYLVQRDRQRAAMAFEQGHNGEDDPEGIAYADVEVGKRLLREGMLRDAEEAFRRGLKADPSADTHLGIGLAYLAANQLESAIKQFREAGRRSHFDSRMMLTILDALNKQGAYGAAQELVLDALAAHPDDHNLWTMRSITEYGLKGAMMDKSVARKARLLAMQEGDQGAVQVLDDILSMI